MEKHTMQCFKRGHTTSEFLIWCVWEHASVIARLSCPGPECQKIWGVRHGQMIPEVTPMDF